MGYEGYIEDDDVDRFEEYAEDLSEEEDRQKVVDEDSAIEFLKKTLRKDSNLQHLVPGNMIKSDFDKLVRTRYVQDLITNNKKDSEAKALRFENQRKAGPRRRDESRTAKDVRAVTPRSVASWEKRPGRFDLKGIDTKRKHPGNRRLTYRRTSKYYRIVIARMRRDKTINEFYQYRSTKTGRFISAPSRKN